MSHTVYHVRMDLHAHRFDCSGLPPYLLSLLPPSLSSMIQALSAKACAGLFDAKAELCCLVQARPHAMKRTSNYAWPSLPCDRVHVNATPSLACHATERTPKFCPPSMPCNRVLSTLRLDHHATKCTSMPRQAGLQCDSIGPCQGGRETV
jgi:hypothetical protein